MIPNQWYAVLESGEVPRARPVGTRRLGRDLTLWRDERGAVRCLASRCPHRGASLAVGHLDDGQVVCPFHGFRFTGEGRCTLAPCNGVAFTPPEALRAAAVPAAEAAGFVFLWLGDGAPAPERPRFFDDLGPGLAHAGSRQMWRAHYARMIENQLDVAHLPFVHGNTIGRGGRTLVDGPLVEWLDPDRFRVYVFNRVDDGSAPRRASQLERPDVPFHLEFLFPNLWQNHIGPGLRIVAAFAPVDDESSVLYLRTYQRLPWAGPLARVICRLSTPANDYIARQDRRVVETQRPYRPELRGGEKLVPADGAIIAYRRRRSELLAGSAGAPAASSPTRHSS